MSDRKLAFARRVAACVCVCVALTFGAADPARAELDRAPAFERKVSAAIDKGAEWLLEQLESPAGSAESLDYQGYPTAGVALAYHTLRVCGVPRTDPRMERAYLRLREEYVKARDSRMLRTYSAAIVMMAIEDHARVDRVAVRKRDRYAKDDDDTVRADPLDLEWMKELVAFLEEHQRSGGTWRYSADGERDHDYDHSNVQYALLGLKSASRMGVEVKTDTYKRALEHLLDGQEDDGPKVRRKVPGAKGSTQAAEIDEARGWARR